MIRLNLKTTFAPKAKEKSYDLGENFAPLSIDTEFLADQLYRFSGELDYESAAYLASTIPERDLKLLKR